MVPGYTKFYMLPNEESLPATTKAQCCIANCGRSVEAGPWTQHDFCIILYPTNWLLFVHLVWKGHCFRHASVASNAEVL
jgi:hypothetical protein